MGSATTEFSRLQEIVALLRGDPGCPWDRRQTAASLGRYLREECAELCEAIESGDTAHVCEETGDLLFILSLLARILEEEGGLGMAEALAGINAKMIRRHPHVFEGLDPGDEQEMRRRWEEIKAAEKKGRGA